MRRSEFRRFFLLRIQQIGAVQMEHPSHSKFHHVVVCNTRMLWHVKNSDLWKLKIYVEGAGYHLLRSTRKQLPRNNKKRWNFRTAPYYCKINLFSQWQCIVFAIVFSIQRLNAKCRMGLCGNFTKKIHLMHGSIFFLAGLQGFVWLPIKNNMAEAWKWLDFMAITVALESI